MSLNMNSLEKCSSFQMRVDEFKSDKEKMAIVNDFLEEICEKARIEAELRKNNNNKHKNKFDVLKLQGSSKKIGIWSNRAKTSARSLASRVFTAICNCSMTVRNATSAVINRN